MDLISLQELTQTDFYVSKVLSLFQFWNEGAVFNSLSNPKKNHTFLYFAGCDGVYTFPDGSTFTVSRGDVVYIPTGACYKTLFCNKQENLSTILINFQLQSSNGPFALSDKITVVAKDTRKNFNKLFYRIAQESSYGRASSIELRANLLKILSELQKFGQSDLMDNSIYSKIAKGIAYLENYGEQQLSIDEIASMCGVSSNTFRRMFHAYAGISPTEYRIQKKIQWAQQLLESENFTVSEVSDMLNFSDVSYFSRIFKSKTGMSPLDYLKSHSVSDNFMPPNDISVSK